VIYLFDSSALVAHALDLPGAAEMQTLIEDDSNDLFLSALSLFELAGVLKQQGAADKVSAYWEAYRQCATVVPADADLARTAWEMREAIGRRIPLADAIIAASARTCQAILVHRDQHLAQIPESLIPQIRLPFE
jgi:predicted nucleic acid-binding protein